MAEIKYLDQTGLGTVKSILDGLFAPKSHNHNNLYYTKTESDNLLAGKSNTGHDHNNVYAAISHGVHWNNFSNRDLNSATWGTLTAANGYTPIFWMDSVNGGGVAFSDYGGQTFMQIDGDYYANEGRYKVWHAGNLTKVSQLANDSGYLTSLPSHSHDYLPLTGGTLTGTSGLALQNSKVWVQGGSAAGSNSNRMTLDYGAPADMKYQSGKRGLMLYSNGIAICDPYNGNSNNDSAWIRHIEETANTSVLEIALGDDGDTSEELRFRKYNTSNQIVYDILVPRKSGIVALTSDIPSSLPASDVYAWAKAANKPIYKTSEVVEETNLYFTNQRAITACSGTYLTINPANLNLHGDWTNDFGIHFKEGGSDNYGFSLCYGNNDTFKLYTRNDAGNIEVFNVGRGSTTMVFASTPKVGSTLVSLAGHVHNYISAKDNYTFNSSTLPNSFDYGLSCGFVSSDSGFGNYGSVLTCRTYTGGGGTLQLYAPYSATYGGTRLKARFGNYDSANGNSWTTLKEVAWLEDIPTNNNQLTNGAGYITSINKTMVTNALGYTPPTSDTNTWLGDGAWAPATNVKLTATANNQEWSFDIERNGKTGCYWHVWDSALLSLLKITADDGIVEAPYGFKGSLSGNASSATLLKPNSGITTDVATWHPLTSFTKCWGQKFTSSVLSSDTGDILYYLRRGDSGYGSSGTTELCICIDGDYYGKGGGGTPQKVSYDGHTHTKSQITDFPTSLPANGGTADAAARASYLTKCVSNVTATTRSTDHGHSMALFTSGWASNSAGFHTTYGTTLDLSGYSTWYHRLAFGTDGQIEHWMGINTNTLTNQGRLCYTNHSHTSFNNNISVTGSVTASAGFFDTSDERLKDIIDNVNVDIDKLSELRKVYFNFKNNPEKKHIGVIAQDIQKIYPEIVEENTDGMLTVDYSKLSVIALDAVDQLNQKNKELEDRLNKIENLLKDKGIL